MNSESEQLDTMIFTKSNFFDPRQRTNQLEAANVNDEFDDPHDPPGVDPVEEDSDSDEATILIGDVDQNVAVDPGENLANKPDGQPRGFMKKEGSENLTVEDEPGTTKIYKMQLYSDDVGGNDVYTCLGKVKEEEYYVRLQDLKLRVDIAHEDVRLSLYRSDHGIGSNPGHSAMRYWNQFYKEITSSPFLAGQPPVTNPVVRAHLPSQGGIKKRNTPGEDIDADYLLIETLLTDKQRKKVNREQQSIIQQEDQMIEDFPPVLQHAPMGTGGNRYPTRARQPPKLSEEQVKQQNIRIEKEKAALKAKRDLKLKEKKKFLIEYRKKEQEAFEEKQRLDLIAQQNERFVKDQFLMYRSRLKNSGRATRWSAKARYRTHLPGIYTVDKPLNIYMTVSGDLVKYFKVDSEVIATSESEEMQKWLDAFRVRTMQLKFRLHYATLPPDANQDLVGETSLKVGGETVNKLQFYACHPAQFYHLYVEADVLPQLRGAPVKRGEVTSYEPSWKFRLDYVAIAQFLKENLEVFKEYKPVDGHPERTREWVWRGNGDTATCLDLIKYGMAREAKRSRQQKAVMGCSATEIAKLVWGTAEGQRNRRTWAKTAEWLHRSGFRMGGLGTTFEKEPTQTSQTVGNLVFGTKETNTAMLRYEDAAARIVEYWERARYEALYPQDEMVHTFVGQRFPKLRDENDEGNNGEPQYEVRWKRVSLKRFTFKQWLERSVKAGNAIQDHLTADVNVRPKIDERLIEYCRKCYLEDLQNPFLTEAERKRQLNEALRNRTDHDGPQKVHPLSTYGYEHGHLVTSTLTAANIPIILDLYDAIIAIEDPQRDRMTLPASEGRKAAVGDKVLKELTPEVKARWEALPLPEQHRAAALTGWIAKTLTWDFSINFPDMYDCKTDTYDDRIRNIKWNKHIQMSTEFDLNSRYTPFMMEVQLDEQFDTTLWDAGFFKATGPKWEQVEVPIPNLRRDEEDHDMTGPKTLRIEEEIYKASIPEPDFEEEIYKAPSSTSDIEEEIYKAPSPTSMEFEEY